MCKHTFIVSERLEYQAFAAFSFMLDLKEEFDDEMEPGANQAIKLANAHSLFRLGGSMLPMHGQLPMDGHLPMHGHLHTC